MSHHGVYRMRLERLADKRENLRRDIAEDIRLIELDNRSVSPAEEQRLTRRRAELAQIEGELPQLASEIERIEASMEISRLVRGDGYEPEPAVHRTFAQYARDQLIVRYPSIAAATGQNEAQEFARERLERVPVNTTSSDVAGLVPAAHMSQILDVIDKARPVVASGRSVPLERGKLTYPQIIQRPEVLLQSSEKTEGGTANMQITMGQLTAETYIGGGDLSWQTINWSTPDALQLWFDLAAEAYARQTEVAACESLEAVAIGTIGTAVGHEGRIGTAGTESFDQWRAAAISGARAINSATGGRVSPDTLYVSAARFFQLAGLASSSPLQLSSVGGVDVQAMSGQFTGLRVIGSYGLSGNSTIVGDSRALLVGEQSGNPVELRVVEPAIGGMEVGVIGAFAAKVFDVNRFIKLNA